MISKNPGIAQKGTQKSRSNPPKSTQNNGTSSYHDICKFPPPLQGDSAEEDDDDLSYGSSSSEENESEDIEEDTIVWNIPEDYTPSGVESDDDSGKCCHW